MTASMIEWTLEILEWIRTEIWDKWPEAQLRGSAPDIQPVPYKIRFRDAGTEYWLTLQPQAMCNAEVADVRTLLEEKNWIGLLKERGCVSVGVAEDALNTPILQACKSYAS